MKLVLLEIPYGTRDVYGGQSSGVLSLGKTDGTDYFDQNGATPPVGTKVYVVDADQFEIVPTAKAVPDAAA